MCEKLFVAAVKTAESQSFFPFCRTAIFPQYTTQHHSVLRVLKPKLRMPFSFHSFLCSYVYVCVCVSPRFALNVQQQQQQTKSLYYAWIMLPAAATAAETEHNQVKLAVWWNSPINTNTQACNLTCICVYVCMQTFACKEWYNLHWILRFLNSVKNNYKYVKVLTDSFRIRLF